MDRPPLPDFYWTGGIGPFCNFRKVLDRSIGPASKSIGPEYWTGPGPIRSNLMVTNVSCPWGSQHGKWVVDPRGNDVRKTIQNKILPKLKEDASDLTKLIPFFNEHHRFKEIWRTAIFPQQQADEKGGEVRITVFVGSARRPPV